MTRLATTALMICLVAGLSTVAAATDFGEDGVVDVYAALAVTESVEIDFGTVTDNDGVITLTLVNTIVGDASGIHVGSSTPVTGSYIVSGQAGAAVGIDINGSTTAGLEIKNFTTDAGVLPLAGQILPITLAVGADLEVFSGTAAPGNDQPLNFTVSVNYE